MSTHAKETFGRAAVRLGFVTDTQVTRALSLQRDNGAAGLPHKLIGMIMLEIGALDTTELITVLRELNAPMTPAADAGSTS